jgi:hypothetical protein
VSDTVVVYVEAPTVVEVGTPGPQGPAGTGLDTLTTKGDLLTHNGTTAVRLGVGADGQVLTAQADGSVAWEASGSGSGTFATDIEASTTGTGLIMKSPNGNRWRLTPSNTGLPVFTALVLFLLAQLAPAQVVGIGTDTNRNVITDRSGALTLSNPLAWDNSTNAATTRTNLGLGASWLTNSNAPIFPNNAGTNFGHILTIVGSESGPVPAWAAVPAIPWLAAISDEAATSAGSTNTIFYNAEVEGGWRVYEPAGFRSALGLDYLGTNAATTISNLFASNSLPSGAAAAGAVYEADGSGGSAFVASRTVARVVTTNVVRVNVSSTSLANTNNEVPELGSWVLDPNSTYRVEWAILANVVATNSFAQHGLPLSASLLEQTNSHIGFGTAPTGGSPIVINYSSGTLVSLPTGVWTGQRSQVGVAFLRTSTNAVTMKYAFAASAATNTNAVTLLSGSTVIVTKLAP